MKIIAFGNSRYKRVAHNWALFLQKHEITNYTIYSLDQEIYNYLVDNNINTELLPLKLFDGVKKKSWFSWNWRERLNIINNLLCESVDILHSDLDAIWLKNPLSLIERQYDIVASSGVFPPDVYKKLGYTMCMGWIYYKSSNIVMELMKNVLKTETDKNFDDQREFNRELFNYSKYSELKFKMLDESIVSRNQPHDENTYVSHPYSLKHVDREKFLRNKNLWMLD